MESSHQSFKSIGASQKMPKGTTIKLEYFSHMRGLELVLETGGLILDNYSKFVGHIVKG